MMMISIPIYLTDIVLLFWL